MIGTTTHHLDGLSIVPIRRDQSEEDELEPAERRGITKKKKKAEKTWVDRAKGLIEDESETIDSNERNDLDDPNHMKAKQMWMKPRSTSKWRNQWVGGASSVRARKRSLRPLGADKPVEQVVECGQEGKQPQGAEAKNWQSGVVK